MSAAVVGLALVGGEVITAATLGYVALGLTAAGMITKNKTLLKIGGQLGLAAGVSSIASSFMGAGSSAAGAATSGAGEVMSAAAEDAANMGLAAPSGQIGGATGGLTATDLNYSNDAINAAGKPYSQTPGQLKKADGIVQSIMAVKRRTVMFIQPSQPQTKPTPGREHWRKSWNKSRCRPRCKYWYKPGANLAPTGPATANDPMGNTSVEASQTQTSLLHEQDETSTPLSKAARLSPVVQGLSEPAMPMCSLKKGALGYTACKYGTGRRSSYGLMRQSKSHRQIRDSPYSN